MNKGTLMAALLCLIPAGYAAAQSTPQNQAGAGQQTSQASADQPAKPADDSAKGAAEPSKPAAKDTNTKATPAADHTPVNGIKIPSGSKIYVAPMDGFENYVIAGIMKKKVPVAIVADRNKAEYEIRGASDTEKASWAKMWFLGSDHSNDQASIAVLEIKTGNVVFAYSVNKHSSVRGKQSTGEAIGKHLNEAIGKD